MTEDGRATDDTGPASDGPETGDESPAEPAGESERGEDPAEPADEGERGEDPAEPADEGERGEDSAEPADEGEQGKQLPEAAVESEQAPTDSDGEQRTNGTTSPLLFLAGLLAVAAGTVAFIADLVTDHGILRSLLLNGLGAAILVLWAAMDTLGDPDSRVASKSGAAGTGILLYGVYALVVGVVVVMTSVVHGRLVLGLWIAGGGLVAVLVGFVVFPREAVLEAAEDDGGEDASEEDGDGDGGGANDEAGTSEEGGDEAPASQS